MNFQLKDLIIRMLFAEMKILLLLLLYLVKRCLTRTAADEFDELKIGGGKVIPPNCFF